MENQSNLTAASWATYGTHTPQPVALIVTDDVCTDLGKLTTQRCKAALPFAGKYRLIDFALSNCVNSQIETVGVITQYRPRSLNAHLAYGRPWDLDRREGGLTLLHPYQARTEVNWYTGNADAVYQNQDFIFRNRSDEVLILTGSEICSLDLNHLIARHRKAKADLTIGVVAVGDDVARQHSTLAADREGWVHEMFPPGSDAPSSLTAMGVLLFSADTLSWRLSEDAQRQQSTHDLITDLIPRMIESGDRVMAFQYTGYWNSLRNVNDYWQANLDLLCEAQGLNLQDTSWPIHTQFEVRPPTRVSTGARMAHSLIGEGCIIDGTVEYSILSPGVHVAPGAVVRNAVIMHDTSIEECARVENAILDMDVIVGPQAQVGQALRHAPTLCVAHPVELTVVEKGMHIPAQQVIAPGSVVSDSIFAAQPQDVSRTHAKAS
jgi:glucose-1-phosphate adenylyltransferase